MIKIFYEFKLKQRFMCSSIRDSYITSEVILYICSLTFKVKEEKLASWKKLSAVSQMSPNPDTMEVQMQRSHHLNDEDDTEVDKENVAQGTVLNKIILWKKLVNDVHLHSYSFNCLLHINLLPAAH